MEVDMVVDMVEDMAVDMVVDMVEDMVATVVAMGDMDTEEKREKLMPSLKLMLLQSPMLIMGMEAMEADTVEAMVDMVDTAMGAKGDQLNPAMDTVAIVEDMEGMVVMGATVAMDMVVMAIMVETYRL